MKVLLVLNHYLPHQVAGTEVYTSLLACYLKEQEVDVKVLIPNYGESEGNSYLNDQVQVVKYAEPSVVDRALILGLRKTDGLKFFEDFLTQEQPDIVHFQELAGSNGITLYHVEGAKRLGFKVIMTFHLASYTCKTGNLMYKNEELCDGLIDVARCTKCSFAVKGANAKASAFLLPVARMLYSAKIDLSKTNNKIGTALGFPFLIDKQKENLLRLYNSCDKVISLTKWYKHILKLNGVPSEKIVHIPQALPQKGFHSRNTEYKVSYPVRLLFVGRISHFKGVHLLLEALQGLPSDKVMLDIYGHGNADDYENKCRERSKSLHNVRWMGKIIPGSVVTVMQQYHALCLASTFSEMSPLVIQEAFAAGIPVIASDVYGNAEQIQHDRNGLLFQFNDANALKQELQRIISDPQLLISLAKYIQPPLDFNTVGKAYLALYTELINS